LGLWGAAESLASEIRPEHLARRQLFPAFSEIRSISAHIGAAVAAKAYELGMAPLTLSWDFYVALACPDGCSKSVLCSKWHISKM